MGGRNAEMTFGIGTISYTELYGQLDAIAGGPMMHNCNLAHLPSDAVLPRNMGFRCTLHAAGAKLTAITMLTTG
jgi:hypothetical protein